MMFTGKTVLITGGAQGIGKAIAERFSNLNAKIYIFDLKNLENIDSDRNIHYIQGDVSQNNDVTDFVNHVMNLDGQIDIVVNNAGIIRDAAIWNMAEADFDAVINVNLKGPWLICRAVAPIMRKQKSGRIINIASRSWLGNFGQSNYSSSKGGLVSLTRVLALELARSNVTVNAVSPGLIDTEMTRSMPPEIFESFVQKQPGKKPGKPQDIASAVTFLASEDSQFINGQILQVDGGKSIGAGH